MNSYRKLKISENAMHPARLIDAPEKKLPEDKKYGFITQMKTNTLHLGLYTDLT